MDMSIFFQPSSQGGSRSTFYYGTENISIEIHRCCARARAFPRVFSQFPVGCKQFRLLQFQQFFSGQSTPPFGCDFISETHFYRLVPVHRISVKIAESGEYPLNHDQLFGNCLHQLPQFSGLNRRSVKCYQKEIRLTKGAAQMTDHSNRKLSIQTRVAQALHFVEAETGAVVPSIQPAATYARDENYEVRKPYWYRRDGSQTTAHAEAIIAEMEEASESLLFASGMSACTAVIEHLPTGSHIVAPKVMYHGVLMQIQNYAANGRITVSYYTAGNLEE
jgi:hypothetical protein